MTKDKTEVKKILLSSLKPNPKNPRSITDENLEKLCKSIKDFGRMLTLRPMIVDENNIVLGGNMRLQALKKLGYKEIPENWVIKTFDLTEEEKRQFLIKDNIEYGDWEEKILKDNYDIFELKEFNIDIDLDLDLGGDDGGEEPKEDECPALKKESIVKMGDLWLLGNHRLKCCNSTIISDINDLMQDEKATLIFTDPPFNIGYNYNKYKDKKTEEEYYQIIKNSILNFISEEISVYVMQRDKNIFMQWKILSEIGLKYVNLIMWRNVSQACPKNKYQSFYQPILFFRTEKFKYKEYAERREEPAEYFGKTKFKGKMNDVWNDIKSCQSGFLKRKGEEERQHPAQMPIKLPSRAIKFSSEENDIVVDMFGGSGSTLIACEILKRKARICEVDPIYCQVIIDRYVNLKQNKGEDVFLLKDGKKIPYKEIVNIK